MAKDLHKGIALDDSFNNTLVRVQNGIKKLLDLSSKFEAEEHEPTHGQIDGLKSSASFLQQAAETYELLRKK
jgi:hypothetical protein